MKINIKNIVLGVLAITLTFCLFQLNQACKTNTKLDGKIAVHEETISTLRGMVDSINTTLANTLEANAVLQKEYDTEITIHRADQVAASKKYAKLSEKITLLETEVQPIIDANPKLLEYVNALKEKITVCEELGLAVTAERDDWIRKYNTKDVDFRAAVKAGIDKDALIKDSLEKYSTCVSDLKGANKIIKRQKTVIKVLSTVGIVETIAIPIILVAGAIF